MSDSANSHHAGSGSQAREVLFFGGPILTMAGGPEPEAVLVRGSRIALVGEKSACLERAGADCVMVDLQGALLMPGFVDAHCHPLMFGQFESWVDCSWENAKDIDAVVRALKERSESLGESEPVRGRGFHQGNVEERRHLRREDLDRVARDREVLVFHSSGHGAYINSYLMRQAGLDADTPDPAGGHFDRDEDGTPSGGVWDAAADILTGPEGVKLRGHGPNFHLSDPIELLVKQLREAQELFLRGGVTAVVDAQVTGRELRAYSALRAENGLKLRVDMLILSSLLESVESLGIAGRLGDDRLAISGVKVYADGTLTGGSAHFKQPYCCDPLDHGYTYHEPEILKGLIGRIHALGLQSGTHAQGDAAIESTVDAIEAALGAQPRPDARHRIEHCGAPTVRDVQRIGELGIVPVTQPQHLYRYGDELAEKLGDRAGRLVPLGEFAARGVPFALSSDAPVAPPRPLEAIYAAVSRRTLAGRVIDSGGQAIAVQAALKAHTLDAAASIHRERELGSLESGKLADLVVLGRDPRSAPLEEIPEIEVASVWIGGERVR